MLNVRVAVLTAALLALAARGGAAGDTDSSWLPACRDFHGDAACSPAMGRWMAQRIPLNDPNAGPGSPTKVWDEFRPPLGGDAAFKGGALFVYGPAGPTGGRAFYDPTAHVAAFEEGCCTWTRSVTLITDSPPPRYTRRDLSHIVTKYGLRLGDSPAKVRSVFGPAPLYGSSARSRLDYYKTFLAEKNECVHGSTFIFRDARLTAIDIVTSC